MKLPVSVIIASVVMSGCMSMPSSSDISTADYGKYPIEYENTVKSYYRARLKDPDSARYEHISTPKTMYLFSRISQPKVGYLVCVTLNAKNSYGAYVGISTDALLIRNDSVIEFLPKGQWFGHQAC